MLFKEELPAPRYALNGDIDDNEILTETIYELSTEITDLSGAPVLVLAPRCAPLAAELGGALLGTVSLLARTTPKPATQKFISATQEFYEVEATSEDFTTSKRWTAPIRRGPQGISIIQLPVLSETEAAFFGKKIVQSIKLDRVVLATPGLSFMDQDVSYMASPLYDWGAALQQIPAAEPPIMVQGPGAALISNALRAEIPALVLVVRSDGPVNHEIISESAREEFRKRLFQVLSLKAATRAQVEKGMSVLYV